MDAFQAQDKRDLLRSFFSDERVQIMLSQLLIKSSTTTPENRKLSKRKAKTVKQTPRQRSEQVIPAASEPHLTSSKEQIELAKSMQAKLMARH